MSLVKYRLKEVAADFGVATKEVTEILTKYSEKPKSPTQVLTDEELNIVFDYITQNNQITSLEVVFAVQPKPVEPKSEPAKEAPKADLVHMKIAVVIHTVPGDNDHFCAQLLKHGNCRIGGTAAAEHQYFLSGNG